MNVLDLDSTTLEKLNDLPLSHHDFVELNSEQVSYEYFFKNYLLLNRPCLLKNVSSDWVCQRDWIKSGKPDFGYLEKHYGCAEVPVSHCNERYFNAQKKSTMKMNKYLNYWQNLILNGCDENNGDGCLYMKDWHYANEYPSEEAYRVPLFFASDWINEYLLANPDLNDDYRFVYMGPKGSWTPLHSDVFSSFSWSVNICGSKKWIFLPPGEEERVKDSFGVLAYDLEGDELKDPSKFPKFSSNDNFIVLIQHVGDAIFVPSNWHHQVWNLDDTISFNHNWVNGCNIDKMWTAMTESFLLVQKEITDCKEMDHWDDQCQLLLKSTFGINHLEFYRFISFIANSRIDKLNKGEELIVNGRWSIGRNHMIFDLRKIESLLYTLLKAQVPCYETVRDEVESLITNIRSLVLS